jgi:hypothetical protein
MAHSYLRIKMVSCIVIMRLQSFLSGSSSVVEYNLAKVGVAGSNPVFRSILVYGALAQLGERLLCTQEVSGSIPLGSTNYIL